MGKWPKKALRGVALLCPQLISMLKCFWLQTPLGGHSEVQASFGVEKWGGAGVGKKTH